MGFGFILMNFMFVLLNLLEDEFIELFIIFSVSSVLMNGKLKLNEVSEYGSSGKSDSHNLKA